VDVLNELVAIQHHRASIDERLTVQQEKRQLDKKFVFKRSIFGVTPAGLTENDN